MFKKNWFWLIIGVVLLVGTGTYFLVNYGVKKKSESTQINQTKTETSATNSSTPTTAPSTASAPAAFTIPDSILKNKFGFLSAGKEDTEFINSVGAGWVRPHPGGFVWERQQVGATDPITFSLTDKEVQRYQAANLGILATLWPFADWDQARRGDEAQCLVSKNDEFLATGSAAKKGASKGEDEETYARGYLARHRCNPYDWTAYQIWVKTMVERYDGDGTDDMAGLKIPIKYWEVMNEPDLNYKKQKEVDRLNFYKEGPAEYAELLIKTSQAIKAADSEAKVLIAGAAGGGDDMLDFYREVFKNKDTFTAFDIANVHCISNDDYQSFNVAPYKKMLAEFQLDNKPIWVTEAESALSTSASVNATQSLHSTKKTLELGASRIFYTQYSFDRPSGPGGITRNSLNITAEIDGNNPAKAYQQIIGQ